MSRRKTDFGVNIGSSSLILIFIVLCLVSFSALSLVSSHADYTLSNKLITRTSDYYNACNKAYEKIAMIDEQLAHIYQEVPSSTAFIEQAGSEISFAIPVNDIQTLSVSLDIIYPSNAKDGFYKIRTWALETTGSLELDESLQVIP